MYRAAPSELTELYWKYTINDIRVAIRLYLGHQQALIVQDFDTMATLLSQAFGGKKGAGKGGGKKGGTKQARSKAEMQMAMQRLFG